MLDSRYESLIELQCTNLYVYQTTLPQAIFKQSKAGFNSVFLLDWLSNQG